MVRGFSLIYKADLTHKAFDLFYNDSNTRIQICNRWLQIFVTDGLLNLLDSGVNSSKYALIYK